MYIIFACHAAPSLLPPTHPGASATQPAKRQLQGVGKTREIGSESVLKFGTGSSVV
jgi:hypothetical protein